MTDLFLLPLQHLCQALSSPLPFCRLVATSALVSAQSLPNKPLCRDNTDSVLSIPAAAIGLPPQVETER